MLVPQLFYQRNERETNSFWTKQGNRNNFKNNNQHNLKKNEGIYMS